MHETRAEAEDEESTWEALTYYSLVLVAAVQHNAQTLRSVQCSYMYRTVPGTVPEITTRYKLARSRNRARAAYGNRLPPCF